MKIPKIVIAIEGGIVQGTVSNEPVDVAVLDLDTESADDDELTVFHFVDEPGLTCTRIFRIRHDSVDPKFVKRIFSDIKKGVKAEVNIQDDE